MIAALVLAAGTSKRMGKPKLTLRLNGESMLDRVLDTLHRSKVDRVVVVLGADRDEVTRKVKFHGEKVLYNSRYKGGMSGSLKLGLKSIQQDADAAMVVLGDQPFVSTATIDKLVDAYKASRALVVAPLYRGFRGNPILFDKSLFPQIMTISGDRGAKMVVEAHRDKLVEVEVEDKGVVFDIDTPSDYEKATKPARISRVRTRAGA
jgi:molybdenum cofactor cytidylyltransferase